VTGDAAAGATVPLVFVTVGTDHHPFDRLLEWTDAWLRGTVSRVRCLVQHGTSPPPSLGEARPYLTQEEMRDAMNTASAIVTHAGPGTIALCRSLGKLPIVVPRSQALGEHVDDHQILFAERLAAKQHVRLARSREELGTMLDRTLQGTLEPVIAAEDGVPAAVERFGELVDALFTAPSARRRRGPSWRPER
jgi:UDP-N-acetylglucosamine transferase subunit ALG13